MASLLPDTDSEDELPIGWEERATLDGKVFYANHVTEKTQWTHPKTGKKKKLSDELPFGWEKRINPQDGSVLFVDHIHKKTTLTDPRLAFAMEEKQDATTNDYHLPFDGSSSTALDVLRGRDLTGKVAIITGGSAGIGVETVKALCFHGCHVVMGARNLEKAQAKVDMIKLDREHCGIVTILKLDLSSFESVATFCSSFRDLQLPLHMLILNAGMMSAPWRLTSDGIEETFQTNHLSHFLMTILLEDILVASSPSRVIFLSSESHRFSLIKSKEHITKEYLSPGLDNLRQQLAPIMVYNDTKLCNVLFANELNKRLQDAGHKKVTSNSVHPGNLIATELNRHWWFYRLLFYILRPFTKSLEQGAATTIFAATSPSMEGVGGVYFNNCTPCPTSSPGNSPSLASALWTLSLSLVSEYLPQKSPQSVLL